MKQILLALAITAFACTGVQAQQGCKTTTAHKYVTHRVKKQRSAVGLCKVLPYEVCSINADRKSLTCFKTMDPDANVPLYGETTKYGPTGKTPDQVEKPKMTTIVMKGEKKGNRCIRDDAHSATVCYYDGSGLTRDEDGFYHYR